MAGLIEQRSARVVVVETVPARRMLLADVLRGMGFASIVTVDKPQDLLTHLKVSPTDWVIMPLASDHTTNGMHILKIITTNRELHHVRVSMLFTVDEKMHIPLGYELGMLSHHPTPYNREGISKSFEALLSKLQTYNGDLTLVAADYLRQSLRDLRLPFMQLALETSLNDYYSGSSEQMVNLGKAHLAVGDKEAALSLFNHAELLNKQLKPQLDHWRSLCELTVAEKHALQASDSPPSAYTGKVNLLGLNTVVVVDADPTVQFIVKSQLKDAGTPDVQVFNDGALAWAYLEKHPEPDLIIQEWRTTGLAGPLLLQRVRQHGFRQVPIIVASSLIKQEDAPLILEMGVSALLEKPFNQTTFFKTVIATVQQHRRPSEQISLERRIRELLAVQNLSEASRLWEQYAHDSRIPPPAKKYIEAEFLYARGEFSEAAELASQALSEMRDSLPLLNLLGKALLKSGKYNVALKCFGRAQELSPDNVDRLCRIAEVQHYLGDDKASDETLREANHRDQDAPAVREMTANLALSKGDVKQASHLMGQLESLQSILAFMNNRAIALTRAGQFDNGIALYRNTLMSLPGPWGGTHNAVTYNLGLAYARYGEIDKALDALEGIQDPIDLALKRKCGSLTSRLEDVKVNGGALQLQDTSERPLKEAKASKRLDIGASIDLRRGDICCHLLFHGHDQTQASAKLLLMEVPAYHKKNNKADAAPAAHKRRKESA